MARTSASSRTLVDHDEIRQWAEERDAKPSCVKGTGGEEDVGMIRLDFPGYSGEDSLEEIGWDDWFQKFDESNLALLVQEETARGERSNFNKLVGRENAEARRRGVKTSRHHPTRGKSSTRNEGTRRSSRASTRNSSGKSRRRASSDTRGRKSSSARGRQTSRSSRTSSRTRGKRTSSRTTARSTSGRKSSARSTSNRRGTGGKAA